MRKDCLYEVVDFRGRQLECDVTNQMMKPLEYGTKSTWNEDFYCKICKYSFRLKTKELNLPTTREFQTNHPKSTPKTRTPPPQKKQKQTWETSPPRVVFNGNVCRFISSSLHSTREPRVRSKVVVAPSDDMTISSHGSKSTKRGTDLLHIIQLFLLKKPNSVSHFFWGLAKVQTTSFSENEIIWNPR